MPIGIGWKVSAVLLVVIAVLSGVGYFYYKDTQSQILILTQNAAKLDAAVNIVKQENTKLKEDFESQAKARSELSNKLNGIEVSLDNTNKKLRNHNLTLLALKKSGLVESRINDATRDILKQLEQDTK